MIIIIIRYTTITTIMLFNGSAWRIKFSLKLLRLKLFIHFFFAKYLTKHNIEKVYNVTCLLIINVGVFKYLPCSMSMKTINLKSICFSKKYYFRGIYSYLLISDNNMTSSIMKLNSKIFIIIVFAMSLVYYNDLKYEHLWFFVVKYKKHILKKILI